MFHRILSAWNRANLIKRISIGIVTGALLALIFPQASAISLLGQIFVGGLKAIAPLLVFTLVANALSAPKRAEKQYENRHYPLSNRDFCSCPCRCPHQLCLSCDHRADCCQLRSQSTRRHRPGSEQSPPQSCR